MEPIRFVATEALRPLVAYATRVGASLPPFVSQASRRPLPLLHAGALFADLAAATEDEAVGLRVGRASQLEDSPLGRDVCGSPTLGAALSAANRLSAKYTAGQRLVLRRRGDRVWVERSLPSVLHRGRRQANDFAMQILIDLVRRAAGPAWKPSELHLEGPPPGHAEELSALSAGSTCFGAATDRFALPLQTLVLPLPAASHLVDPATPLPDLEFVESIRLAIHFFLETGGLSLQSIAQAGGTSTRSLQRRLALSGYRFNQLVDEVRFQMAIHLLRRSNIRIIDVSVELGYNDAANFTRAFRRWAGVSPLVFREAARSEPGATAN